MVSFFDVRRQSRCPLTMGATLAVSPNCMSQSVQYAIPHRRSPLQSGGMEGIFRLTRFGSPKFFFSVEIDEYLYIVPEVKGGLYMAPDKGVFACGSIYVLTLSRKLFSDFD